MRAFGVGGASAVASTRTRCLLLAALAVSVAVMMIIVNWMNVSSLHSCVRCQPSSSGSSTGGEICCGHDPRIISLTSVRPGACPAKPAAAGRKMFATTAVMAVAVVTAAACVRHGVQENQACRTIKAATSKLWPRTGTLLGHNPPSPQQHLPLVLASVLAYGPTPVAAGRWVSAAVEEPPTAFFLLPAAFAVAFPSPEASHFLSSFDSRPLKYCYI